MITPICAAVMENEQTGSFTDLIQRSGTNYITLPITPIYWDLQSLQDCVRSQEFSAGSQAAREQL